MYHYSIYQWVFFFYFYCFFGWVFESTYVSICKRKFVNRGFMRGPFLPIYGSGAIMMLLVSMPFHGNLILTYVAGCVGATILELVTGLTMEALFKVRYWDYSNQKFNYKGVICLSSTVVWGFLTILMTQFLHRFVEQIVFMIPATVLNITTVIISVGVVADFTLSFKAAIDLRNVLVGLEKAHVEMERIQKRLDVIIALANNELEAKTRATSEKMNALMDEIEEAFGRIKERINVNPSEYLESMKDELAELKSKYYMEKSHRNQFGRVRDWIQRGLIKGNPTMVSRKYQDALETLRQSLSDWNDKKNNDNK